MSSELYYTSPHNGVKYYIIPKGTTLYRFVIDDKKISPKLCGDTGKYGTYFALYPKLAESMSLGYASDGYIKTVKLISDLTVGFGKYSFRYINPSRYFDEYDNIIDNVEIIPSENISHVEFGLYPVIGIPLLSRAIIPKLINIESKMLEAGLYTGEIFISSNDYDKFVPCGVDRRISWIHLAKNS